MKQALLFLVRVSASCVAVRSQPRLDSRRTPEAEAYAAEASLVFWTEWIPNPYHPHHFLTLLSLGLLPAVGPQKYVAHLQVEGYDGGAREGHLEVSQASVSGWLAWCWWILPGWEMGSLFSELDDHNQRMKTTLLSRLAKSQAETISR